MQDFNDDVKEVRNNTKKITKVVKKVDKSAQKSITMMSSSVAPSDSIVEKLSSDDVSDDVSDDDSSDSELVVLPAPETKSAVITTSAPVTSMLESKSVDVTSEYDQELQKAREEVKQNVERAIPLARTKNKIEKAFNTMDFEVLITADDKIFRRQLKVHKKEYKSIRNIVLMFAAKRALNEFDKDYSKDMKKCEKRGKKSYTLAELKEIARKYHIDYDSKTTKSELCDLLREKREEFNKRYKKYKKLVEEQENTEYTVTEGKVIPEKMEGVEIKEDIKDTSIIVSPIPTTEQKKKDTSIDDAVSSSDDDDDELIPSKKEREEKRKQEQKKKDTSIDDAVSSSDDDDDELIPSKKEREEKRKQEQKKKDTLIDDAVSSSDDDDDELIPSKKEREEKKETRTEEKRYINR